MVGRIIIRTSSSSSALPPWAQAERLPRGHGVRRRRRRRRRALHVRALADIVSPPGRLQPRAQRPEVRHARVDPVPLRPQVRRCPARRLLSRARRRQKTASHHTCGAGCTYAVSVPSARWVIGREVDGVGAVQHDSRQEMPNLEDLSLRIPTWRTSCSRIRPRLSLYRSLLVALRHTLPLELHTDPRELQTESASHRITSAGVWVGAWVH